MVEMEEDRFLAEQKRKCDRLLEDEPVLNMTSLRDGMSEIHQIGWFDGFDNDTDKSEWRRDPAGTNVTLDDGNAGTKMHRCPPFFDSILCWPSTNAPGTAILPCPPPSIMGYTNLANNNLRIFTVASKVCLANGEWYQNSDGVSWGNYSLCTLNNALYVMDELEYPRSLAQILLNRWLPIIRLVSQIGYATSFATLIVAMMVFSLLRKLRNPRNRLHMHLFASFIMRAFMALLKDWIFVDSVGLAWDVVFVDGENAFIKEHNTWVCKIITSLWQYFIVANYSWILMEGLYLHNLVFLALCADTSTISSYILLGWGLPALIVVPWVAIRVTIENTLCWTTHENRSLFLIIAIPIMISILLNFVLFLNIVRVLLMKLKTSVHLQRKKMQYKRWAKSTLVLVPLFGAHYTLFTGLSYHRDYRVELVGLFCDQLFASFQGAFVAVLYCFLNGEVRAEIRRTWKARRSKRDVDSFTSGHRETSKSSKSKTNDIQRRSRHRSEGDDGTNFANIAMKELSMP